jgi:hypothetical protein
MVSRSCRAGKPQPMSLDAAKTALDQLQPRWSPHSTSFNFAQKWRRRESNVGPVIIAENVGAIRGADSGEESGACADSAGAATAGEHAGEM